MNRTVSHRDYLKKRLADRGEATAYLNAVADDGNLHAMLKALRNVAAAQGGMGALAKKAKQSRVALERTLSEKGKPRVGTLDAALRVYGLRIGFSPIA